jgi:molybdopterin converting factor small subunit
MAIVTLRYWAAAKDAAGVADEKVEAATLADALAAGLAAGGDERARLGQVLAMSSFLVNGEPVGKRSPRAITLTDDSVIEVLPPFAGG